MSRETYASIHGSDTPESLPRIATDAAERLGLTDMTELGGISYHEQGHDLGPFWAYATSGRDSHGQRVYITAYTEARPKERHSDDN